MIDLNNSHIRGKIGRTVKIVMLSLLFWAVPFMVSAQCVETDTELCLLDGRFKVEVTFQNFSGNEYTLDQMALGGHATPVTFNDDTGFFWFFTPDNIEMVVRILDGTQINGNFWVFEAATTNVEYTLTITDTTNDSVKSYYNPGGNFSVPITDVSAFSESSKQATTSRVDLSRRSWETLPSRGIVEGFDPMARHLSPATKNSPPADKLLLRDRFQVDVIWRDFQGNQGKGTGTLLNGQTSGYFWFFSPSNIELIVKVLDGSAINGNFWFFFSSTTNVGYMVTLTDTYTGKSATYTSDLGVMSPTVGDNDPDLLKHYYGAHLASNPNWRQRLIVYNNGADQGSFSLDVKNTSGEQVLQENYTVNQYSSKTLILTGDPGYMPGPQETPVIPVDGTFIIHTDSMNLRPLLSYQYQESPSPIEFFLDSAMKTEYLLPNRMFNDFSWSGIAVMNPHGQPLDITMTAYKEGQLADEIDVQIPSGSKYVDLLRNTWPGLDYTQVDQIKFSSLLVPFPPPFIITGNDALDKNLVFNGAVTGSGNVH